ncbi:MAG: nicotinate-nicotinamide nucleotide adenylyltransferase, partial [Ruminococcaceae bacterium]|nr:nicotinate-nicotinamide nucleotide adenylyltransferase [Oscillospiraceae bacterium]
MKKILLYGGAFNPPHKGHERLLSLAIEAVKPALTLVVPSGVSPHKRNASVSFFDREVMAARAFKGCGGDVRVSGIERAGKHKKSYTIKTVKRLKRKYANSEIYLLIGSDMLTTFSEWHLYRRLLKEVVIVAAVREDEDKAELMAAKTSLEQEGAKITVVPLDP